MARYPMNKNIKRAIWKGNIDLTLAMVKLMKNTSHTII